MRRKANHAAKLARTTQKLENRFGLNVPCPIFVSWKRKQSS